MCPAFWLCQTKLPETGRATLQCLWIKKHSPFSYFKTTPPIYSFGHSDPLQAQQGLGVGLQDHRFYSRTNFKLNRAAALAE